MTDDADLIKAAASGDMAAFRQLYDRYLDQVTRTVGRYLGPCEEIQDVVQEVFIELHRSLDNISDPQAFGGWVYRVARNVSISHLRSTSTSVTLTDLKVLQEPTSQWRRLKARQKMRALYTAMNYLSGTQRDALVMYEIEGHTLQEIADITDTSVHTIASRVRRGRQQLLELIEKIISGANIENKEKA